MIDKYISNIHKLVFDKNRKSYLKHHQISYQHNNHQNAIWKNCSIWNKRPTHKPKIILISGMLIKIYKAGVEKLLKKYIKA